MDHPYTSNTPEIDTADEMGYISSDDGTSGESEKEEMFSSGEFPYLPPMALFN